MSKRNSVFSGQSSRNLYKNLRLGYCRLGLLCHLTSVHSRVATTLQINANSCLWISPAHIELLHTVVTCILYLTVKEKRDQSLNLLQISSNFQQVQTLYVNHVDVNCLSNPKPGWCWREVWHIYLCMIHLRKKKS